MDSGGGNSDSMKPEAATGGGSHPGCGCASSATTITVRVTPTTGGQFDLAVTKSDTVENLKKLISKKLKVPKERICLLHRDRQLREGTLEENQLMDGSRLTLLPSVETGLLAQRPEQSVMQALESLNDSQVNDFLSGKAPLNLTMRLGDHMMLIQLQLSTVTPSSSRRQQGPQPSSSSSSSSSSTSSSSSNANTSTVTTSKTPRDDCKCEPHTKPTLDTRALAEASRNLTQTLKQLSSEDSVVRTRRQGAIIESMHHHGKGVYSGTFSGTLNPALQDRFGRPKRDISTIIHILNDLLCATPQYRRHARQGHSITVEAAGSGSNSSPSKPNSQPSEKPSATQENLDEPSSLSRENQATRGKMEHLRLIMEERRARRRARREARVAPYTTQWSAKSESLPQPTSTRTRPDEPMETSEQPEQQLCELNPPEPVAA